MVGAQRVTAFRRIERSFSQWGMFAVAAEFVEFEHLDCARDPADGDYVSMFRIEGRVYQVRTPETEIRREGVGARLRRDAALLESVGIDATTTDHS